MNSKCIICLKNSIVNEIFLSKRLARDLRALQKSKIVFLAPIRLSKNGITRFLVQKHSFSGDTMHTHAVRGFSCAQNHRRRLAADTTMVTSGNSNPNVFQICFRASMSSSMIRPVTSLSRDSSTCYPVPGQKNHTIV